MNQIYALKQRLWKSNRNLLITGYDDGFIRVWSSDYSLIYSLYLPPYFHHAQKNISSLTANENYLFISTTADRVLIVDRNFKPIKLIENLGSNYMYTLSNWGMEFIAIKYKALLCRVEVEGEESGSDLLHRSQFKFGSISFPRILWNNFLIFTNDYSLCFYELSSDINNNDIFNNCDNIKIEEEFIEEVNNHFHDGENKYKVSFVVNDGDINGEEEINKKMKFVKIIHRAHIHKIRLSYGEIIY